MFLSNFPHLRAGSIDLPVAQEAASVRAGHGLRTPDALVVGTGLVHQVGHLVTNDRDWASRLAPVRTRVQVCYLASFLPWP
ncbi:MAG: hypothetical protein HYY04_03715 [Chloroflexi bacterium]|nr:hypothetical protein [Chloroflexota bacterium]